MKVFILGIKGTGTSGLAVYCSQKGYTVWGSDVSQRFITDPVLEGNGIRVLGFDPAVVDHPDIAVYSVAYPVDHSQLVAAAQSGAEVLTYPQMVGRLVKEKETLGVAGCHGKSTTSAMLSYVLSQVEGDVSYIVGAPLVDTETNAQFRSGGRHLVIECDEYRRAFHNYHPLKAVIITNVDHDHPDCYADFESVLEAYVAFIERSGAHVVCCADDPGVRQLLERIPDAPTTLYGAKGDSPAAEGWTVGQVNQDSQGFTFHVRHQGEDLGQFRLRLIGAHNILNALGVIALCHELGLPLDQVRSALQEFRGIKRRCELLAARDGVIVLDDYAHHPQAIGKTLEGVRRRYPGHELWCIFQPHTFSRTEAMLQHFARSLAGSDRALVLPVFSSAREKAPEQKAQDLGREMARLASEVYGGRVDFVGDGLQAVARLKQDVQQPAVVLTMGAGDVYELVSVPYTEWLLDNSERQRDQVQHA